MIISTTCLVAALLAARPGGAPPDDVDAAVARVLDEVIELRRDVHAHPELGEREVRTAALVASHLSALGLEVREGLAVTGVVGVLRGGRPGGVVAYRADMDALPVTEQTGLPFASRVTDQWDGATVGVMHACGHDVHTAIGLGLASILADPAIRPRVPGTVLFLFQPAEEGHPDPGPHGAERMLLEGAFEGPRPGAVFGLHTDPSLRVGEIGVVSGGAMAAVDRFRIQIRGVQTHGAYPQNGVDPIVAASQLVLALQTIASRSVDTRDSVVVTVGKIAAGNRYNIVPATCDLVGTIRTHDDSVRDLVHARMEALVQGVAVAQGATADLQIEGLTPVLVNDPALLERMRGVLEECAIVPDVLPHMGGEDFAFLAREVPGLYYFLGVADPDSGDTAMIHTPFYAPDERAIPLGLETSTRLLLAWLEQAAE